MVPSNFLMACSTLRSFAIFFPTAVCSVLVPPVCAARALPSTFDFQTPSSLHVLTSPLAISDS